MDAFDDFAPIDPNRPVPKPFVESSYQAAICNDAETGSDHVVVRARAGSGKTETIVRAIRRIPERHMGSVLLAAFNSKIADELRKRAPSTADVMTLHSYGFRAVIRHFGGKPEVDKWKVHNLARELLGDAPGTAELRSALQRAVAASKNTLATTVEQVDALVDAMGIDLPIGVRRPEFASDVLAVMERCKDPQGVIDFDDQIWLPVVLGMNTRKFDRVFIDETQDLNPVQIELAMGASKRGSRITAVGDDRQCHPAGVLIDTGDGWKPIEKLKNGDRVRGWNRNAQKMVAGREVKIAVRPYTGKIHTMFTEAGSVPMTPNHRLICRWNDRSSKVCVTYLMWREGFGFRVGWCKLFTTSGKAKLFHLAHRARMEKADRVWVLKTHDSRTNASVYESIIAAKYGLPTSTFEPVHGAQHLTRESIAKVFAAVEDENLGRGVSALLDHGREFECPLYPWPGNTKTNVQGRRTYFEVYAANLMPGLMSVPLPDKQNAWAVVDRVETTMHSGPVYSLDVDVDHSYAANGVVVLNSIYAFRGADAHAMDRVRNRLGAKILPLSVSYRCARSIVKLAQQTVPDIEAAPDAREGEVRFGVRLDTLYRDAQPGDFILSRINAPLLTMCLRFLREGRRATIQGRAIGDELALFVRKIDCDRHSPAGVQVMRDFVDAWKATEVARLVAKERDTQAVEDKAACLHALAEQAKSVAEVERAIATLFGDKDDASHIVLSSTHRAKGMERERAWLIGDTFRPARGIQEANLWYVGVTRAKGSLQIVSGVP